MKAAPASVDQRDLLDRMFLPEWAGAWALTRILWAVAALLEHGWRVFAIEDAYAAQDMVYVSGVYRLADVITLTAPMGYALWAASILGIGMVAWGGRATKVGLVLWGLCAWTLMANEALNVKAHDRLLTWIAIGLLLSPAHERGLTGKYRSPAGRIWILITYCAIYGSTGLDKALHEPTWWTNGEVLGYHFLNHWHGGGWLAVALSDQLWLLYPMGVITVVWEVAFPFLVWFRKINPWLLVIGAFFHGILLLTMQVGPFAFVAWSAYPVLLHPEVARSIWERFQASRGR